MLWVPQSGPAWSILASSNPSVPTSVNDSVNFTIPANDTYSGWANLLPEGLSRAAYGFTLRAASTFLSGVDYRCLIDLGIDYTGGTNYQPWIPELFLCGYQNTESDPGIFYFPIRIPAGARIGIRGKSNHTANATVRFTFLCYRTPPYPWVHYLTTATPIQLGRTGYNGTVCAPGLRQWGNWVSVGTTPRRLSYLHFQVIPASETAVGTLNIYWEVAVGNATNKTVVAQYNTMDSPQEATVAPAHYRTGPVSIPAGAEIFVRGISSGTTSGNNNQVVIVGM